MSAFIGNIDDINEKYIDLVPIGLRYSDSYLIYFALLSKDQEIDLDAIDTINDLITINKTSYNYVDGLWQYLNTHKEDKNRALDFYEDITNNLISYGESKHYLDMYEYLVPESLTDSKEYKIYLIHLVEFYSNDVENAETPEDLEDPTKVSLGTLENIWSYYNYNIRLDNPDDKESLLRVVTAIRDIWEEKREEYLYLIPEYLRTNDGFLVFLSLMVHEFEIAQQNIDNFTDLVDPDKVPLKFLENLGAYMNYRYLERGDEDFNREALMSMSSIWEMRGTDHAIIMAATHGYNPGYVGGDLFIPGYPITNELAELIIGSSRAFVHSRSKFSGIHVYPDQYSYRPGIIILIVPFINGDIRQKIYEVMPAGVKYVFWLFIAAQSDNPDETGAYGEMTYNIRVVPLESKGEPKYRENNPANLFMEISPEVTYDDDFEEDAFTHSVSPFPSYDEQGKCYYQHLLSGKRLFNIFYIHKTNDLIVCALNLDLLKIPYMGESYTGQYKISPSGEYLDNTPASDWYYPSTMSIKRTYDYCPDDDNIIYISSNIVDGVFSLKEYGIDKSDNLAVSCLPISLQSEFFSFGFLKTNDITLYDDNVPVKEHLSKPFYLLDDDDTVVGTIDVNPVLVMDDGAYDPNYYYISPTGEYLDNKDKDSDTILRTLILDYRPDVEIDFIPA